MATETDDDRRLDPLALPLRGSRLIEASAGTGKTWTIAALYLRLVLGHGRGDDPPPATAFVRPLAPAEILVMTFTRAATRELSDRIRARLVQAARCFRGDQAPDDRDAFLRELMAHYPEGPARAHAAWRLAMAAESMDDAAVMTIDSWCQRMLREHAFDSGSVYDEELQPDEAGLRAEAARDYWRHEVYPLSGEALERVLATWPTVDALEADVQRLLALVPPAQDDMPLAARLRQEMADERADVAQLKAGWTQRLRVLRAWLMESVAASPSPFKGNVVNAGRVGKWFDELDRWAADPASARWCLEDADTRWLSPAGLAEALKKGARLDFPPEVAHLEGLAGRVAELSNDPHWMREHAAAHVARRIRTLKARAGTFGFADLQERLDAALAGPGGPRLRERMVTQFPAVLVDEFQDTSPLQYRIFDRLYRIEADDPRTALFLIGDPKQSIYAFRGADLNSYLRARRATQGRHSVLGRNYRSTTALVEAVNALFERAERRGGRGAFLFGERQPQLFLVDGQSATPAGRAPATEVPFEAVTAAGRREVLHQADGPAPALVACVDAAGRRAEPLRRSLAARCAEDIVQRLQDPSAGFDEPGRPFRRLRPGDIAVIVRNGTEAEAVRRALRARHVPSVYLSDRESVFDTRESADLLRWLRAVADPLDGGLARAAWATSTVDLPLADLAALRRDDAAFESRVEILRTLHLTWRRQGVLPMLRQTLHLLDLPGRWLAQPADGERRLTNVLHLAELLQDAAARCEGEHALIRWFAAQVAGRGTAGDEKLVRLESDADLVQVVTGHKSKGLEYPLVYLPFACSFRGVENDRHGFVTRHDPSAPSGRQVVFGQSAKAGDPADEERLQEDLRWLYVALTRPRHLLWVGVGAVMQVNGKTSRCVVHRSAMGYLLAGQPVEAESLPGRVAAAFRGVDGVRIEVVGGGAEGAPAAGGEGGQALVAVPEAVACTRLTRRDDRPALVQPPPYEARFDTRWSIGSFSRLVRDLGAEAAPRVAADALREAMWQEMVTDEAPGADGSASAPAGAGAVPAAVVSPALAPAHRFPRGAFAGNFLHEQLEWLAGHRFALEDDESLGERLAQRCRRQGWGHRADDVRQWLARVVSRPLPPFGTSLSRLQLAQAEMEFWLPGEGGQASRLDALCRAFLMPGRRRPPLPDRTLRGMLMGFADLVVEHGGRWWVLDYKSNALGTRDTEYTAPALEEAVASHRYDVQAAIYLLALHRLLRSRLGDAYDPASQVGGAVFLFLRGIDGPEAGCVTLAAPPTLLDALDRVLAGNDEAVRP